MVIYTALLSLFAVARGSAAAPGFAVRVLLVAVSGFVAGFFLDGLARSVPGSGWRRFWVLGAIIFCLTTISNVFETVLYLPAVAVAGAVVGGLIQTVILAGIWAILARPASSQGGGPRLHFGRGSAFIAIMAVAWIPVYFLFETLDTPVVHMLERGGAGVFSHPALGPMLALELLRGVVHGAVVLAIAALAGGRRRTIWIWGGLAIAILNGWLPILPTTTLPLAIRIANGVEITCSAFTFAGIAAYVFGWLAGEDAPSGRRRELAS